MGDIEREPSKRKVPRLEGFGKLSDGAARTEAPGDEDGAGGGKPSLPRLDPQDGAGRTSSPLPQQQQAAESCVEEGDPARRQMEYLVSQIQGIKGQLWEELKAWISADDDPDSSTMPPACAGTPPSSPQINVSWDSTQTEAQPAATAGQCEAATGASGSGQPQPLTNAGAVVEFLACHNNRPHADRSGKEAIILATEPLQHEQHQPQNPAAPTSQFNGNLFRRWMPSGDAGWLKDLQVPEEQRCPECNYFPGPLVIDPPQHVCICAFCRELLICPTCTPPSRQGKGESGL